MTERYSPLGASRTLLGTPSPSRLVSGRHQEMDDEESVLLLKSQISQVRAMKLDVERKEALIAEQRQQLAELQRYRDQYYSTRASQQLAEEKLHLQEQEFLARNAELQERVRHLEAEVAALRKQTAGAERDRADETRQLRLKISELEAEAANARAEVKRVETKQRTAQYELEMQQQAGSASLRAAKEREDALNHALRRSQEQVAQMAVEKRGAQDGAATLQAELERARLEIAKRDQEIAAMERTQTDQASVIAHQRREMTELEERIRSLTDQAAQVPVLRSELRTTQQLLAESNDQLVRERHSRRMLDEVKKRVEELNTELEEYHSPTRSSTSPARRY